MLLKNVLLSLASLALTGTLQANALKTSKCWTEFETAPDGLTKLCKLRYSEKTGQLRPPAVAFFFEATFENDRVLFPVYHSAIVGGSCFWGEGYSLMSLDSYTSDAQKVDLGYLAHCDNSGATPNKIRGTLPGSGPVVTN